MAWRCAVVAVVSLDNRSHGTSRDARRARWVPYVCMYVSLSLDIYMSKLIKEMSIYAYIYNMSINIYTYMRAPAGGARGAAAARARRGARRAAPPSARAPQRPRRPLVRSAGRRAPGGRAAPRAALVDDDDHCRADGRADRLAALVAAQSANVVVHRGASGAPFSRSAADGRRWRRMGPRDCRVAHARIGSNRRTTPSLRISPFP